MTRFILNPFCPYSNVIYFYTVRTNYAKGFMIPNHFFSYDRKKYSTTKRDFPATRKWRTTD